MKVEKRCELLMCAQCEHLRLSVAQIPHYSAREQGSQGANSIHAMGTNDILLANTNCLFG